MAALAFNELKHCNNILWFTQEQFTQKKEYQKQPPEVFYKKIVLKNFAKLPGKHLWQSLFFIKLQASATLAQVFSSEFCEIFKKSFFAEQVWTTAYKTWIRGTLPSILQTSSKTIFLPFCPKSFPIEWPILTTWICEHTLIIQRVFCTRSQQC